MDQIPLSPVPAQTCTVTLGGQACRLDVFQKSTGLFVNLYLSDVPVVLGVIAQHANRLVREPYGLFVGDLAFFDLQGTDDPQYDGLGSRWVLGYLTP